MVWDCGEVCIGWVFVALGATYVFGLYHGWWS